MNDADLARLAIAKRAFLATQPSEPEVQTGVRRARLALRRPRPRRRWLSKGLVFVVLAVGGLAYAKPHALGEWVAQVLEPKGSGHGLAAGRGGALPAPADVTPAAGKAPPASPAAAAQAEPGAAVEQAEPGAAVEQPELEATVAGVVAQAAPASAAELQSAKALSARGTSKHTTAGGTSPATKTASAPQATATVSEWGRVGQALAAGDEQAALAGLNELATSDDPRTRDKADLGRAQLLLAHGNRDAACALARSLTRRRAGERIERQAQALLKSCGR